MDTIMQALRNLGPMRLAIMGIVVVGMIGFFIYLTTRLATPQLALLYSDLEPADSGKIVTQLEQANIPFELRAGGTEIYVPGDQALKLRVQLADQGLPQGGSLGYEIFDQGEGLGATNFMQNVNLVRALEGELARTIQTINGVNAARVHLVMPKRELFARQATEPSASIVLSMAGARRLSAEQVSAVQHLVATAIPGLSPTRVSIVDDKGSLLAEGFEQEGATAVAAKAEERRLNYERRMERSIEELLERTVGFGRVRAEVTADMDFDRISTQEESYDPDGQVVRSTQTIEETNNAEEAESAAPVSVGGNLPDPLGLNQQGEQASNTVSEQRTEETVNFEISKKVINHVREVGVINRLSVAVLVDGKRIPNPDGEGFNYEERTQEELNRLGALVRNAIGFEDDRGDTVEIISMQFAEADKPEEEPLQLFFGLEKNDLLRMAEILVLSIVAILVILLVVRPLVTRAFEAIPAAAAAGAAEARLLAEQAAAPALAAPGAPVPAEQEEEDYEDLIDIDRVEGRVKASSVKKVGEIVDKHPEEALSIIRTWMYQES